MCRVREMHLALPPVFDLKKEHASREFSNAPKKKTKIIEIENYVQRCVRVSGVGKGLKTQGSDLRARVMRFVAC